MPDPLVLGVFLAIVAVVAVLFAVALVRRSRRDAGIVLAAPPADPGPLLAEADGLHLATTLAGRPYDRAPIPALFFRSMARIAVHADGVEVDLGTSFWIPVADLTGAGRTGLVIDRVVESGGLVVLGWRAATADGPTLDVESSFRLEPSASDAILVALHRILPGSVSVPGPTEESA